VTIFLFNFILLLIKINIIILLEFVVDQNIWYGNLHFKIKLTLFLQLF